MTSGALTVIVYHYVRFLPDLKFPYIKACGMDRFAAQLDYFQERYKMIAWPDLSAHILKGTPLPENACLLTFDDGLRDGYANVFPELCRRGISGLFFVMARRPEEGLAPVQVLQLVANRFSDPAQFKDLLFAKLTPAQRDDFEACCERVRRESPPDRFGEQSLRIMRTAINTHLFPELDRIVRDICAEHIGDPRVLGSEFYLGDAELREMVAGGMFLGGHGRMHHRLTRLSPEERDEEICSSVSFLHTYGRGPFAFSYPYGDYDEAVIAAVRGAGFAAGFAVKPAAVISDPWYEIGRTDTVDAPIAR